jgi:4-hydroxyphenylacetate 3-monooxygenase
MRPKDALLYASQVFQQAMYPGLLNQIRGLMGGSLVQLPATVGELRAPDSAPDIERYVRWPKAGGRERVKLLKLLWDALGSEFGSRHLQ